MVLFPSKKVVLFPCFKAAFTTFPPCLRGEDHIYLPDSAEERTTFTSLIKAAFTTFLVKVVISTLLVKVVISTLLVKVADFPA